MARMIDLMKQAAVPANMMRSAARGALALPPAEMIEILVYLTTQPLFAETARMTLAGWDEKASFDVCKDPNTPWEVLEYWLAAENRRPKLIPALLENHSVREVRLQEMAQAGSREIVGMMLASQRVLRSRDVLQALTANAHLNVEEADKINAALKATGDETGKFVAVAEDGQKTQYEIEHAAEIEAEEEAGQKFELVGATEDEHPDAVAANAPPGELTMKISAEIASVEAAAGAAAAAAPAPAAAPALDEKTQKMRAAEADARERVSTIQKISRMKVGERVQLAMKGSKDERFVLIRDGSKVVSSAVLESPKLSDAEVETFAGMKNVQESVLRGIAMKRKFMKNYAVIKTLVNNPRCPLDLGLTLMNHLIVGDLKALSMNKNVSETLRKMALKNFKQKTETKSGGGGGH